MKTWNDCKHILCIRPDNMGDLIMSGPAMRALKHCLNARITVLTSSMAAGIAKLMPEIDEVIVFDVPWVKTERAADKTQLDNLITSLRDKNFDAAVIFTVFSQSPLPTAMLAYQAGIPRILAYCRENPYGLITDWVPDEEPYALIRHQVKRDLNLVAAVGAKAYDENLALTVPEHHWPLVQHKLQSIGVDIHKPWLLVHPGVSEAKRRYPTRLWIETGKILTERGYQLIITGTTGEAELTGEIKNGTGADAFNSAGLFTLDELVCLVKHGGLLLSVNTGTVHIAAAVGTPSVVLYAQTNPQHIPWRVPCRVLPFPVDKSLQSKNEVLRYLQNTIYKQPATMPAPIEIVNVVEQLLRRSAEPDQPFREIQHENRATAAN